MPAPQHGPAPLGILMLDTQFPRIPGDIGNPASFDFPVLYKTVRAATPDKAVRQSPEVLLPDFIDAGRALVAEGAAGITTSCGFLVLFQKELAAALPVPVLTSSLMQVPLVEALLPKGRRAGVLTISASSLSARHLVAAGVARDTPTGSTEGGRSFTQAILSDAPTLDVEAARAENVQAAVDMTGRYPDLGAIVLECTNMAPYAADIRTATGLPVYSILTCLTSFQASLSPPHFNP